MSEYAGWIDGGATGAEALGKLDNKLFTPGTAIVLNPTYHQVTERGAGQNMSVDIAPGAGLTDLADYSIPVWSNAIVNKTVAAADPTNPRKDIVVRYVSLSSFGPTNNQSTLKFIIVSGTPAGSPSDPSDATIQAAVGAGNPWEKLARITLPASATPVVNAYITDLRVSVAFAGRLWGGASNTTGHQVPNVADDIVALLVASQAFTNKIITDATNVISAVTFSNPYKFSVYLNSAQSLPAGGNTTTKILYNAAEFDTSSNFDLVTNHRFTAPIAGFYQIDASMQVTVGSSTDTFDISLFKNGSEFKRGAMSPGGAGTITLNQYGLHTLIQLAANDYLEVFGFNSVNATRALTTGGAYNYFQAYLYCKT